MLTVLEISAIFLKSVSRRKDFRRTYTTSNTKFRFFKDFSNLTKSFIAIHRTFFPAEIVHLAMRYSFYF